jgi:putative MATE family efflux protein
LNLHHIFENSSPGRLFFRAAIPGAIGMSAISIYFMFEGMFIGRVLGETAFAALNLALPFIMLNTNLADLIGVGSSVPISVSLGQKDKKQANNIFTCASIMIFASAAIVGLLMYFAAPYIINMMKAEGELAENAVTFLRIASLLSPFVTILFAADNYLRICGKTRASMLINLMMAFVCLALQILFVIVLDWGVIGCGIASNLGMAICGFISFFPFVIGKMELRFCKPKFSMAMIKQIVACGAPNFLSTTAGRLTSIVLNTLLLRLGGSIAVSIYGILMSVDGWVQSIFYGVCDALQPAISYNWGAGKVKRVNAIAKYCFAASAVVSTSIGILMYFFADKITFLYLGEVTADVMKLAVFALGLFCINYFFRWGSFATQSFMLAIERPKYASLISICTAMTFPLLALILVWPVGLNLTALWLNVPVTMFLAAVQSVFYMAKYRQNLRKTKTA